MSKIQSRRTSRPRRNPDGSEIGKSIFAEPGALVSDVSLQPLSRMHVTSGAEVIRFEEEDPLLDIGTVITVDEGAIVRDVAIVYTGSAARTPEHHLRIGAHAKVVGSPITDSKTLRRSVVRMNARDGVEIGAHAKLFQFLCEGHVVVGDHSEIRGSQLKESTVGSGCRIDDSVLFQVDVGDRSKITLWRSGSDDAPTTIGSDVTIQNGGTIEGGVKIGNGTLIKSGAVIGEWAIIGTECVIGGAARIKTGTQIGHRVQIAGDTHDRHTLIAEEVSIGNDVVIGPSCAIRSQSKIGNNVTIGVGVEIKSYAIIGDGVNIGDHAKIESGVRVTLNVLAGATVTRAIESLPTVVVHANAESWILSRVADVMETAGQKRLDKRVLAKELPTLVETHCVKQLLRMAPPPDVDTMREMAKAFSCAVKYDGTKEAPPPYDASVVLRGWSGMQVMGEYENDVIVFRASPDVLDSIVPGYSDVFPGSRGRAKLTWQIGFLHALMQLGKGDSHPGGTDPSVIGWARVVFSELHSSVLCEELQTDLAFLAWDPSMELWGLSESSWSAPAFQGKSTPKLVADLLTEEGVVPHRWEAYVRRMVESGEIKADLGERVAIMPSFRKDKATQQRVLVALAMLNAARINDQPYNPEINIAGHVKDDLDWSHWFLSSVGRDLLGDPRFNEGAGDVLLDDDVLHALDDAKREWPIEAARIVESVRGTFGDFYESALAGVLQVARKAGMKEVWVPDYETKYAVASYAGAIGQAPLEPPRSVYTELPKKFGVTQVQPLPEYMDVSAWHGEADERRYKKWPRVTIPEAPRGRRLLANATIRR